MKKSKNSAYDEFGNYCGDDDESDESSDFSESLSDVEYEGEGKSARSETIRSDESEDEDEDEEEEENEEEEDDGEESDRDEENKTENKNESDMEKGEETKKEVNKKESNLSDLQEAFGDVEVFLEEEDTQDIEQATINKINTTVERISFIKKLDVEANRKNFDLVETSFPANTFRFEYLSKLMHQKEYVKNICIAGHFHHGKTTLVDRLIEYTRSTKRRFRKNIKGVNKNSSTVSFFTINDEKEENFVPLNKKDICHKITPHNSKKDDSLMNYTDSRLDEQARGLSIKATPISLIFQNRIYDNIPKHILLNKKKETNVSYKSYVFNIIDTPGHVNFFDEFLSSVNICDCCCLVVDITDGCMYVTEKVIQTCIYENIKMVLILNCLDKLIMDLRLPPNDAYHKINYTIEEINMKVESICDVLNKSKQERNRFLLSPLKNNVLFSSSLYGVFFTLKSFSKIYCNIYRTFHIDIDEFAQYLWGDIYFNEEDFTFSATPLYSNQRRSFVEFILNPLYKIFGYVCSEEKEFLIPFLQNFNIKLKNKEYLFNTRYLLKRINSLIFKNTTPFVDVIVDNCPSPVESARNKILQLYSGALNTKICFDMLHCLSGDKTDNLMIYIVKNYHRPECLVFDLFGRVMCGTIRKGQTVRILGEGYRLDDEEDMITRVVTHLWIYEGRYRVEVDEVPAGNFVMIGGVDICINKTCTVTNVPREKGNKNRKHTKKKNYENGSSEHKDIGEGITESGNEDVDLDEIDALDTEKTAEIFYPLRKKFQYVKCATSVFKIACEPLNPSELPKMLDGLRKIDKSYPLCETKVEESGEHVILGTGELYMDCILHDLRRLYGDLEVRVSDPVVQFSETVLDTSVMNCFAETPNKKNKIHVISEPLQKDLMEDIMQGLVYLGKDREEGLKQFVHLDKGRNKLKREKAEQKKDTETEKENEKEKKKEKNEQEKEMTNLTENNTDVEQNETLNYNISDKVVSILSNKYEWDLLSIRSIWTFGPENNNPNILIDDTLYNETNKANLYAIKDNVIHGFCWATREGPLLEENMKNVKVKILRAEIDDDPIKRSAGQIIPTVRRVIYSSFLLASPRILEPILFTEIICSGDCVSAVYNVLSRRRGHILKDFPKVGTPLYIVHAYIPAIESFGFETDLRTHTSGQAFCLSMFDHWHIVPGDPMDKSIMLRPLEPAPVGHLAREFMLKTRRRKGLQDDITINMFFDDPMLANIKDEYAEFF